MMRSSFRNRLTFAFATIGLLPLLLAGALISWHSYRTQVAETRERQLELAKKVSDQVAAMLQSAERDLAMLIRLAGPKQSLDDYRPLLERLLTERSTYREVALLDGSGAERFRLSNIRLIDAAQPPPAAEAALLEAVAAGRSYFSQPYHDPTNGEPLMGLAVPIVSPRTGRTVATVFAEVRVRFIWDVLARQRWRPGEEAYIIDDTGLVIAHINPSVVLGGTRAAPAEEAVWRTGLSGDMVLAVGYGRTANRRPFTVIVERKLVWAMQPAFETLAMLGGAVLISVLLAGGLFLLAVRSVVKPVQAISQVAKAVRDGELGQHADVASDDEIGQLAATFNDMTVRLRGVLGDLHVEIAERRQAEARLIKINNAYQALSGCSTLLADAQEEGQILNGVARIVTNVCGYRLVWLGLLQGSGIRPVASDGFDDGYLDRLNIDLDDPTSSRGPTATALRELRAVTVDDVQRDPSFTPWRAEALRRGFRSVAAIPLLAGGDALGVLTVYSDQESGFSAEEIRLLGELAANVGHGLVALRLRNERQAADQALRESEAKLRRVTNALPALLWTWIDGGVVYFNARWYAYTGLTEEASLGERWQQAIHPGDLPMLLESWRDALARGGVFGFEARLRRHDGVFRWFLVQAEPVDDGSAHPPWIGTCVDIEDRKRGEAQLIQASKLATLGELAAGMAHEMGQPLNIIRMIADSAVLRMQTGRDRDGLDGDLQRISDQTRRMGELIEHMRAFSRDDNLLQEVFDLGDVVEDAVDLLSSQLRANGLTVEIARPPMRLLVLGNRVQLEQVVLNLLTNARDAIESKPTGRAGAIRIGIAPGGDGQTAAVTVADTGPGIPADLMDRIFEPFVTTKTAGRGTGLGLAICLRIITHMKGRLHGRNTGTGAEFAITLPLSSQGQAAAAPDIPVAVAGARQRVLVVDDEVEAADILSQFLTAMGYQTLIANSGPQALDLFAATPADIVVTDITMPSGDGIALLRQLRHAVPDLPAVVVTGRIDAAGLLAEELANGRTWLLRKPISIRQLSALIADLLCRQPASGCVDGAAIGADD